MTELSRRRLAPWALSLLLLLVGAAVGAAVDRLAAGPGRPPGPPTPDEMTRRLTRDLSLSDAQARGVRGIVEARWAALGKLFERMDPEAEAIRKDADDRIRALLPEGMEVLEAVEIPLRSDSLSTIMEKIRYRVTLPEGLAENLPGLADAFLALETFVHRREKQSKTVEIDLRRELYDLHATSTVLEMVVGRGKPAEFAAAVTGLWGSPFNRRGPGQRPATAARPTAAPGSADARAPLAGPAEELVERRAALRSARSPTVRDALRALYLANGKRPPQWTNPRALARASTPQGSVPPLGPAAPLA